MPSGWDRPSLPFTVSIEARLGVTTGISAPDRARTIRTAVATDTGPDDLVSPGHVFPLRAAPGGLLARGGAIEAALELSGAAGVPGGAMMTTILDDDGAVAGRAYLATAAPATPVPKK
jgi:3,4-dihydroxy 2-butanone 4-phosphate synthase/GTP cyclohydrolase II